MNAESLRRKSTVVVTGIFSNGETVFQEMTLEHDTGAPSSVLIGQVFNIIRQVGGLSVDSIDGESMDFYHLIKFDKINFSIKSISLAAGNLLRN